MKVCICGTGYVGLTSGACLAEIGHDVACVDIDEAKIAGLVAGEMPIYEPGLEEMVRRNVAEGRLSFTTSVADGVKEADVVFICVSTPAKPSGEANLIYVENVAREIGRNLSHYTVVAGKSTVPVQTADRVREVLARENPHGEPFDVISNPEFLREGQAIFDNLNPDRIVVGSDSERATAVMRELYAPVIERTGCEFLVTDIRTAELIKHASNAFLAMKVSYINAVAEVCERTGADVRDVANGMGMDSRIGPHFLKAGAGYGGSCFPKDVRAFIYIAEQAGYDFTLLKAASETNDERRDAIMRKVTDLVWNLEGKRVAIWGLAFKPNTDDLRNAPALALIERLIDHNVEVSAFDPHSMEKAAELLPGVRMGTDAYDAARGADCLVLMTEWDEFKNADLDKLKEALANPCVVDGRNIWDPEEMKRLGFEYRGVGR
jgi:UDPglucose 6-dehydrogenase